MTTTFAGCQVRAPQSAGGTQSPASPLRSERAPRTSEQLAPRRPPPPTGLGPAAPLRAHPLSCPARSLTRHYHPAGCGLPAFPGSGSSSAQPRAALAGCGREPPAGHGPWGALQSGPEGVGGGLGSPAQLGGIRQSPGAHCSCGDDQQLGSARPARPGPSPGPGGRSLAGSWPGARGQKGVNEINFTARVIEGYKEVWAASCYLPLI